MPTRGRCRRCLRRSEWVSTVIAAIAAVALAASSLVLAFFPVSAASGAPLSSPQTARGCNQAVCIYVEGVGSEVTYWSTAATLPASRCTVAKYWANGALVHEGNMKCGPTGGQVSSYWQSPGRFSAGTVVCNTWTGFSGMPCETIE